MHEVSLAKNLIEQMVSIQEQHPLSQMVEVEIELGPLSGVEPLLLSLAFERLVGDKFRVSPKLIMQEVALQALCEDCHLQCTIDDFKFVCAYCHSTRLKIVQGDCVQLSSISLVPLEFCDESLLCSPRKPE